MNLLRAVLSFVIILLFIALLVSDLGAQTCGVERQAVKTLQDSGGHLTFTGPQQSTIEELTSFKFPEEKVVYTVTGTLVGAKLESDGDYHVVISSPKRPALTMIVEIPSPQCMPSNGAAIVAELRSRLEQLFPSHKITPKFRALVHGVTLTVTGPGFFDIKHGVPQTGVAPNGFEIHPVQSMEIK